MTYQAVQAVWAWRFTKAPFKATYGRLADDSYSKDFLQASGDCAKALDDAFQRQTGDIMRLQLVWPGGSRDGSLFEAADYSANGRLNLRWETDNAPDPWHLYPPGSADPLKTLPGDPTHKAPADADAEWTTLEQQNLDPWLIVVKLYDEPETLHVRAYLGAPPVGLEHTATSVLPDAVRDAMSALPANRGCTVLQFDRAPEVRAPKVVREIEDAFTRGPNVLLVGPPGTGKTVALEDLRGLYERAAGQALLFDPSQIHDAWSTFSSSVPRGMARAIVFHPSYSYEEFVLGLFPSPTAPGASGVNLELHAGPLLSLAHWAEEPGNEALLVVDEFNRGNAAAIFGDTIALLDREKRADASRGLSGATIDRAYGDRPLDVLAEFATSSSGTSVPSQLVLPAGLRILAALNSSDRSVAPIDAALRRRFAIVRVDPDYEVLAKHYDIPVPTTFSGSADPTTWSPDDVRVLAVLLLRRLNERIELVLGADFLLGHALLWGVGGDDVPGAVASLAAAFDERVATSLRMTFADQDEPLAAILKAGVPPAGPTPSAPGTPLANWLVPTSDLASVAVARLRMRPASTLPWLEAAKAIHGLL